VEGHALLKEHQRSVGMSRLWRNVHQSTAVLQMYWKAQVSALLSLIRKKGRFKYKNLSILDKFQRIISQIKSVFLNEKIKNEKGHFLWYKPKHNPREESSHKAYRRTNEMFFFVLMFMFMSFASSLDISAA